MAQDRSSGQQQYLVTSRLSKSRRKGCTEGVEGADEVAGVVVRWHSRANGDEDEETAWKGLCGFRPGPGARKIQIAAESCASQRQGVGDEGGDARPGGSDRSVRRVPVEVPCPLIFLSRPHHTAAKSCASERQGVGDEGGDARPGGSDRSVRRVPVEVPCPLIFFPRPHRTTARARHVFPVGDAHIACGVTVAPRWRWGRPATHLRSRLSSWNCPCRFILLSPSARTH
ncbi:hypothetical protein B0H19DRAFT_525985 [Mycena capillaripes]|nr:hypothetical protein B0H19DRAFT_525985 [Mycena capillaripes]